MHFVIGGGGTGGHIYPAVAVAERLVDEGSVTMLARSGSLEERIYRQYGFHVETIRSAPLAGGPTQVPAFAGATGAGIWDAWHIMFRTQADAFIGTGGYVSVPGIVAAWMRRTPVFLLEQNSIMGRANRLFQCVARRVFLGFPIAGTSGGKFVLSGNPLRKEVSEALADIRGTPMTRQDLLFLGGSGGATFVNDLFLRTVDELDKRARNALVSVITGNNDFERVTRSVAEKHLVHVKTKVLCYEQHPEHLYGAAKVAVTRGGALVLTELATAGVFSVVIPYPYAVDGHQSSNAAYIQSLGLGIRIEEDSFAFDRYIQIVEEALDASNGRANPVPGIFAGDAAAAIATNIIQAVSHG